MRTPYVLAAVVLAGALPALAKEEAPLPEPPTTPLPAEAPEDPLDELVAAG